MSRAVISISVDNSSLYGECADEAIKIFGIKNQIIKLQEELGELCQAYTKALGKEAMLTEMVDVAIVLESLFAAFPEEDIKLFSTIYKTKKIKQAQYVTRLIDKRNEK